MLINFIKNNSSSILTGMAIFGAFETAFLASKATINASDIVRSEELENPKEIVRAVWKCYIPPALSLIGTALCIFAIDAVNTKEKAGLIAAYSMAEAKNKQRILAEQEVFGEQAEAIDAHLKEKKKPIFPMEEPKHGKYWCYEPESEQFFQTTTEEILWAELTANKMFTNNGHLTFNQFLNLLPGCKKVPWGDHFGWYTYDEDGSWDFNWSFYPGGTPWIDIQPVIINKNDRTYLEIAYGMHPGDDLDCHDQIEEPEQY